MKADLANLLAGVVALAKTAGEKIMLLHEQGFSVQAKRDQSPLTEADMAAHAIIDDGLELLAEEVPLLSEESAGIPFEYRSRWERYWLVDPLDGTREFVQHRDQFTVNIALVEGHDAVLGVVYAPALKLCYYAARGIGAYKQQGDVTPERIKVCSACRHPVIVAGSRSHTSRAMRRFLDNLGDYQLIPMGSALKSCLVADGTVDIYPRLGLTSEWDTAAAQCIVEEAGGYLTDIEGRTLRYNLKDELLNPHFLVYGDPNIDWQHFTA